ncbi:MAG: hypothetical protein A2504_00355 [Bdellovibrionales bacterium RIFOXYD12_FULL_39_22]|nr:MAG: hypothetical protein A2385_13935 [Bdellovibrionales bacterium RIFOXYB1_FULL_39_21]OFZ42432.1 MAG: hypothetical protein A2485_03985 [Bdellovibrionales bacterium RIFOXYC12_FULL_39_17]OFZ45408.1 MAG: hypothetical protein A2404_01425 [Bdellovibrionales bacterium RIFOXYC1_FULL_39_130]OFZ68432.1 MAG: hypothetical protein A2451_01620 [Bdellovibrionales bacterium RIFOXYC2_FULL_39_8]OFZ74605.1 MAG: hypothetical protein A2560_09455 [Bdellovibrionales bacterium RIFOXYD1_FULL_39_84]OFZ92887.1 MAG:
MNNSAFPTLLNRRARLFAGMRRSDLMVIGVGYIVLSWLHVAGISGLVINAILLFLFKIANSYLPRGFFLQIFSPKVLNWSYRMEVANG